MMDTKLNIPSSEELAGLPQDGGPDFNRLVFEKSPYLLQHARNPVNWYSWGEEAFQQARDLERPVFLSIGYSTCHWCHVMEKESFEDQEVAELLNAGFVAIKVDREERPDIDQIYMAVCQAVTGMGGWPLTVILTPDRKPFFAGTYFPKESRFGRTGMLELLPKVSQLWAEKRDQLISSAEQITDQIKQTAAPAPGMLQQGIIQAAYLDLHARFDRLYGGFGSAPKFPAAHNLLFLLRFWRQTGEPQALEMVERTLDRMRLGGIYDQVGFGFHRYSTDEAWLLPHFEKMLYDQALLAMAYTEAFLATGKELYSRIAREVLSYVRRDLSSHAGGFYSAEDADSEGEEGLFYLWGVDEFQTVLGKENGNLFGGLFNLKPEGNYYDEAQKTRTGRNILYLKRDLAELAGEHSLDPGQLNDLWERQRRLLFSARESRIHPLKDDKVLTDWNGLMITALARAGAALAEPDFLAAAEKAADFIWNELRDPAGRLLKRYRDGEAGLPAHLDDYAFLIWGLIEIYQARFNAEYLARALELTEVMIADFWDGRDGGFFLSRAGQKDLIMRAKEIYDGAIPSGNSAAAFILIRLARLTGRPDLEEKADRIGQAFAHQVNNLPLGYTFLLTAQLFAAGPSFEVVISGDPEREDTQKMLQALQQGYYPQLVLLLNPEGEKPSRIQALAPWLKDQPSLEGRATAYVCRNFTCQAPTTDLGQLLDSLK